MGTKILKIPKLIPDLFGPAGASVGLTNVISGFLGVSEMIIMTNQKFKFFQEKIYYFSQCYEWRISLLMQNDKNR